MIIPQSSSDFAGLASWYSADDLPEGYVSQWSDRRFMGNHLTQADAALRPFCYRDNPPVEGLAPDNHPFIRFTGGGTGLAQTGNRLLVSPYSYDPTDWPTFVNGGRWTMMAFFRRIGTIPGNGDNTTEKWLCHAGSQVRGLRINTKDSILPADNRLEWTGDPGRMFDDPVPNYGFYDFGWHTAIGKRTTNRNELYLDGGLRSEYENVADPLQDIAWLSVGAHPSNPVSFFWGDIAEVAVWLNDVPVVDIMDYISEKYYPVAVPTPQVMTIDFATYTPAGGHPPGGPNLPCCLGATDNAGFQQVYTGRDPLPPDDPTEAALSYPAGGGPATQWDVATQAWV